MKNKGFTLIELLAVIVILAVVLAIAIPNITGIIQRTTKNAFESDADIVLKQLDYEKVLNSSFDVTSIDAENINNLGLSNDNYESLSVSVKNDQTYIVIVGKNKWDGLTVCGTRDSMQVVKTSDDQACGTAFAFSGINAPVLATGMTPIKWDGTTWVDTNASDLDWYSYTATDKKWANARTADGSMWVWIPRYIYKISSGWHSNTTGTIDIQFSNGTDDNWNSLVIGNIDTGTTSNASNNKWTNHPAFDFDSTKLTGIWIAKFEASNSSNNVKIIPNVQAWRSITVNDIFNTVRSMEMNNVYGWGTTGNGIDTHMMSNIEWGAVAYLSKSIYGINSEIYKNNSRSFYTGRSGGNIAGSQVKVGGNEYIDTGFYTYDGKCASTTTLAPGINANCTTVGNTVSDTSLSYNASTTGNIYGIYDMVGGTWEYTLAYVNNGHSNLTTYGNSAYTTESKYKNIYAVASTDTSANNYPLTVSSKGDAIYETSNAGTGTASWYGDYSCMTYVNNPWFARGGDASDGSNAGIFHFCGFTGVGDNGEGFHPVLAVGTGI